LLSTIQTWQTRWNVAKNARNPALKMIVYEGCIGLGGGTDVTNMTVNPIGTIAVGDTITGSVSGATGKVLFMSGNTVQMLDSDITGNFTYGTYGVPTDPPDTIRKGGVDQGLASYSGRPFGDPCDQVTQRLLTWQFGSNGAANVINQWAQYHADNNIALFCQFPGCTTWDVTDHNWITINGMAANWETPNPYSNALKTKFLTNP
jgi:hypothetical protein